MFSQRNKASQSIKGQESEFTECTDAEQWCIYSPAKNVYHRLALKLSDANTCLRRITNYSPSYQARWSLSTAVPRIFNQ